MYVRWAYHTCAHNLYLLSTVGRMNDVRVP